ncbi:hypothetical protein SPI_06718 [Niveomyces insectorum RCEF 264]|uniref:Uncharacterized protein n=1 Tax=Niveomyces insectorum RCEF 264 TaxID=1081102 RepID=A0A167RIZ4_9HYPO|nr:hypothetical protein SPI_06718 [Niveomyces insectorum RCEF 264]
MLSPHPKRPRLRRMPSFRRLWPQDQTEQHGTQAQTACAAPSVHHGHDDDAASGTSTAEPPCHACRACETTCATGPPLTLETLPIPSNQAHIVNDHPQIQPMSSNGESDVAALRFAVDQECVVVEQDDATAARHPQPATPVLRPMALCAVVNSAGAARPSPADATNFQSAELDAIDIGPPFLEDGPSAKNKTGR